MKPKINFEKLYLILILCTFVAFALSFALVNQTYRAPDERSHAWYSRYLLENFSFPTLETGKLTWEAHQPPLYYLLGAFVLFFAKISPEDIQVYFLRFLSIALGCGAIYFSFRLGKSLFPESKYIKYGLSTLVALNPQFIFISASYNNDNLANLFGILLLFLIVKTLKEGVERKEILINSLAISGAVLSKVNLAPICIALFLAMCLKSKKQLKNLVLFGLVPILIFCSWWFVRNILVYGDLLAWGRMQEVWAMQHKEFFNLENLKNWIKNFFWSFWGVFGYMNILVLPFKVIFALKIFCVLGVLGMAKFFVVRWKSLKDWQKRSIILLLISLVLVFAGIISYSLKFFQPQGRYLFPVIGVVALCLFLGLEELIPKRIKCFLVPGLFIVFLLLNIHAFQVLSHYHGN